MRTLSLQAVLAGIGFQVLAAAILAIVFGVLGEVTGLLEPTLRPEVLPGEFIIDTLGASLLAGFVTARYAQRDLLLHGLWLGVVTGILYGWLTNRPPTLSAHVLLFLGILGCCALGAWVASRAIGRRV